MTRECAATYWRGMEEYDRLFDPYPFDILSDFERRQECEQLRLALRGDKRDEDDLPKYDPKGLWY